MYFEYSMLLFLNVIKLLLNCVLNVNNILYLLEKQLNSIMKIYSYSHIVISGMIFAQNNKPKKLLEI
jgi:hypothetical protein